MSEIKREPYTTQIVNGSVIKNAASATSCSDCSITDVAYKDSCSYSLPRIRNMHAAYTEIVARDPQTSITFHALRQAILSGAIPAHKNGRRYLVNMSEVYLYFYGETLGDRDFLNRRNSK